MSRGAGLHFGGALLLLGTAFCLACQAGPNAPSPTIDEIVARTIAARGGLEKIRSIRTLRETGHVTAGANRGARVTRERKRPGRMRIEFTVQGITSVQVYNGEHAWKMSPLEGDLEPQPLPAEVEEEAAQEADIEGPLVDWKTKGHTVELAGREMVSDREAYKVKITLGSGAVLYDYYDVESFNRVRAVASRQVRGRTVQIEATFGDYRKTDGVLFPHLIEIAAAGRPQQLHVVVDTIEVNPPISDARFEIMGAGD